MSNIIKSALLLLAGATIGSGVTYVIVKDKFKTYADEEIASVKETYKRKNETPQKDTKEDAIKFDENKDVEAHDTVINTYGKLASGYTSSNKRAEVMKEEKTMKEKSNVYVISPEVFGDGTYETETLIYYVDGILAYDSSDEKIDDINKIVGEHSLTTFGEYEDDSVFVRNDDLQIDFEILKDYRRYSEVIDPYMGNYDE